jgi:hypothetical protein
MEPFLIEPLDVEPGWMDASGGHCRLYHGLGSRGAIDYDTPVALVPPDSASVSVALSAVAGERHFLAARAVSAAGVEEQNTHVVCCVEVDDAGQLLPAPLGAVSDLTAWTEPGGGIVVGFSYQPPPGFVAAEHFEVLSDGGSGQLDLDTPITTIPALPPEAHLPTAKHDYEAVVPVTSLPVLLAVRACADGRSGPVGLPVAVPAAAAPGPVVFP